jgi:tetratricopeptide (TPR) repeat protein
VMRYLAAALAQVESNLEYTAVDAPAENRRLLGAVLASAGGAAFRLGLNEQAIEYNRRSAAVAREVGDLGTLSWVQGMTAAVTGIMGDMDSARRAQAESENLVGESSPLAQAMFLVSGILFDTRSEGEDAWQRWEKGMAMYQQGDEFWGMGMGHQIAAFACLAEGNEDGARSHAEQSLSYYNQIGDQHFANIPRSILADFARRNGELEQAASMYRETMLSWRDKGNAGAVARCLECLAFTTRAQAETEQPPGPLLENAATLLGAAAAVRQAHNSPMTAVEQPEYDTELSATQDAAGNTLFQTAWQRGQLLDLDQAVTFALGDQATPLEAI